MNDESIFYAALEHPPGEARDQVIRDACGDDLEQKRRVDELLIGHHQTNSLLDEVSEDSDLQSFIGTTIQGTSNVNDSQGHVAGRYRLLHLLGEGGMGSVFLAEQTHPVKRRVAVKIIKQGMNSDQFIARFEAERQAIAMMDHPNIAKVLDAGCISDNRPFFVMEHVKGIPITEFCNQNRLDPNERLELFIKVCNAVQHAHQKGIIHRDLKPSNVLVAMYDNEPVPKVIDFGVAKATHQPLTEQTLYTVPGQIVGTWEYMSPEQAILNQLDVDTRTDIYSLGVILYELLTGHTPLNLKSLRPEEIEERLRRIREQEPSRPSLRISASNPTPEMAGKGALAVYRESDSATLKQSIKGDLDWIVMKALEKDRSNRYETANGFAAELKRFLNDEPISFRPPSTWEHLGRFYRRNRALVRSVAVSMIALAIGLVIALISLNQLQTTNKQLSARDQENELLVRRLRTKNQELSKEKTENELLLDQIAEELIEKAMIHALNDDGVKMREALAAASEASTCGEWRDLLEGLLQLYGENTGKAVELLENAVQKNPDNVAANGLLAKAYMLEGHYEKFLAQLERVNQMQPSSEFDRLFASAGQVMAEDDQAHPNLQSALDVRLMPLGVAIEAQSLGHRALQHGDKQAAQEAIRKIAAAREFLPKNRFVRMIEVSVHHTAFNLGVKGIDKAVVLDVIANAGDMDTYCIGHTVNAMTFIDLGMQTEAEAAFREGSRHGNWWSIHCWNLCGEQRFGEATRFLEDVFARLPERSHYETDAFPRVGLLSGQTSIDESAASLVEQATDLAVRSRTSSVAANQLSGKVELLLLAGKLQEAKAVCVDAPREIAAAQTFVFLSLFVDADDPTIQRLTKQSRLNAVQLHYSYGLVELAKGNRERAIEHFDKSIQSKFFFYDFYHKARALRKLLDDSYTFPSLQ